MSDNEWESVDGWNNGEGEEWSDAEPDIETIAEAQLKKFNKYRHRTFSEGSFEDDFYIEESDEETYLKSAKNTAESVAEAVLEESDEESDESDEE